MPRSSLMMDKGVLGRARQNRFHSRLPNLGIPLDREMEDKLFRDISFASIKYLCPEHVGAFWSSLFGHRGVSTHSQPENKLLTVTGALGGISFMSFLIGNGPH